jgi:2,5-diketo-D-gluconate reductase B
VNVRDARIPPLGLGTWLRTGEDGYRAIVAGLELGYRHLDTAQTYGTEAAIGRALRASGLRREDLFITTKVGDANLARQDFLPSLRQSLDRLNVDAVDLTLIHWPSYRDMVPLSSYMEDLAQAKSLGMTRLIGVSNFPCALLDRAVEVVGAGELVTNQVELHPYLQNRLVRACAARHGMTTTAYMPLAGGRVVHDPVLAHIGARHGESAAVVAVAWLLRHGLVAIPASSRIDHLKANLRARHLDLSDHELDGIDALDRGLRLVNPTKAPAWD